MFAVVGDNNLLFSVELPQIVEGAAEKAYLFQFILYASLDSLDLKDPTAYRECIDSSDNYNISAYVTAGQTAFLLLHSKTSKRGDAVKKFFKQVHTAYAELLMNPFYDVKTPIEDEKFKKAVVEAVSLLL